MWLMARKNKITTKTRVYKKKVIIHLRRTKNQELRAKKLWTFDF